MSALGMLRPGMRAYFIPLVAGLALAVSTFLPWVKVSGISLTGFPDVLALWVLGLGVLAAILALLSLMTRKNSRHPLLVIGLAALGIMFLSWRIMPQAVGDRALTISQALSIVNETPAGEAPRADVGVGIYLGLVASVAITLFGLTIIVKRVSKPYVLVDPDDDVE